MKKDFEYSYFAPTEEEKQEIESIRQSYLPKERKTTAQEKLRELDQAVRRPPKILSIVVGVMGLLLFGTGITLVLQWQFLAAGSVVGVVGAVVMASVYPVYRSALSRRKKKYGNEILQLSERLLQENRIS